MKNWEKMIPDCIRDKYEFHNINSGFEILSQSHPEEFHNLIHALEQFEIHVSDIVEKGGNESQIPKNFRSLLSDSGWKELEISADLTVRLLEGKRIKKVTGEFVLKDYITGHKIDYVKGSVAADMEWNSKDQTFDRDLYAFRTFFECGIITCGVIITRSEQLNQVFASLGKEVAAKYGASTTWMGKLLDRVHARRHGGCPLFIVGLTPETIIDWEGS